MFWSGQEQALTLPEYDYYKMWVLLKEFDIKPYEIELIPIEDLNAIWTMYEYELERKKQDAFNQESRSKNNG